MVLTLGCLSLAPPARPKESNRVGCVKRITGCSGWCISRTLQIIIRPVNVLCKQREVGWRNSCVKSYNGCTRAEPPRFYITCVRLPARCRCWLVQQCEAPRSQDTAGQAGSGTPTRQPRRKTQNMPNQPRQRQRQSPLARVLFGCAGWPSGIMELASWAGQRRLARVVVCQMRPGGVRRLDTDRAGSFLSTVRRFAQRPDMVRRFFRADGTLAPPVERIIHATGTRFIGRLIEFDPHVVGFRVEGGDFDDVKQYIRAVRLFSNAEIVLGGPTPTSHPKEVLESSRADYVFAGEAEEPFALFLELARRHNSKDLQADIPGLAFRHGDQVYHNTLPADGYERTALDVASESDTCRLRQLRNALRPEAPAELIAANRLGLVAAERLRARVRQSVLHGRARLPGRVHVLRQVARPARSHQDGRATSGGDRSCRRHGGPAQAEGHAMEALRARRRPGAGRVGRCLGGRLRRGFFPRPPPGDRVLPALGPKPLEAALPAGVPDEPPLAAGAGRDGPRRVVRVDRPAQTDDPVGRRVVQTRCCWPDGGSGTTWGN